MQPQANVAVPQSVTTQPQQIVGVPANAVILKMSEIQQISTVGPYLYNYFNKFVYKCNYVDNSCNRFIFVSHFLNE